MATKKLTSVRTVDGKELVDAYAIPADDRTGDGYDWMDSLEGSGWAVLASWGIDGWDLGAWPYIMIAVSRAPTGIYGMATYLEGDISPTYYTTREALFDAISREAHFHWKSGQSQGPDRAEVGVDFDQLDDKYKQPMNLERLKEDSNNGNEPGER